MKILFSSDHHIKLGQKSVPKEWQKNRFMLLAERFNKIFKEYDCDLHIIGGDILDVSDPSTEELELFFSFIQAMNHEGRIYTGNHEMISKTVSCLDHLAGPISDSTRGRWRMLKNHRKEDFDCIDYAELHKAKWEPSKGHICFTHVRGNIEPHVKPEIELKRFVDHGYSLIIAGDLHSHKNTQKISNSVDLVYPGSPLTTSFHRERTKGTNGCLIIDTDTMGWKWIELGDLPQLIRKTIKAGEPMLPDPYDRVIYEVEGDIKELKDLKGSDLLDKKLNTKVSKEAKLDLEGKTVLEELALYLTDVQNLDKETVERLVSLAAKYVRD